MVRHAGHFEFLVALLIERPAGALEFEIDEVVAGLRLRVIVGVRLFLRCGLGCREVGAEDLEFGIERVLFLLALEGVLGLLFQLLFQCLQFLARDDRSAGDRLRHPCIRPRGTLAGDLRCIGAGEPVAEVVQLLDHLHGVLLADRALFVGGLISHLLDDPGFLEYRFRQQVAESGIMNHGSEARVIRHPQTGVVTIEPADGGLQREAGVETGGAWVAHDLLFRLAAGFREILERWGQEGEV